LIIRHCSSRLAASDGSLFPDIIEVNHGRTVRSVDPFRDRALGDSPSHVGAVNRHPSRHLTDEQGAVCPARRSSYATRPPASSVRSSPTRPATTRPPRWRPPYRIEARLSGFQDQAREIDLEVARTVVVNLRLSVSAVAESVSVVGATPIVETSTVSVGQVISQRTVQEIRSTVGISSTSGS